MRLSEEQRQLNEQWMNHVINYVLKIVKDVFMKYIYSKLRRLFPLFFFTYNESYIHPLQNRNQELSHLLPCL
jgi:fructose-1,6-bisphosphatase